MASDLEFAIIAPDGEVLVRSNTRSAIERLAGSPTFARGVPCRNLFDQWLPMLDTAQLAEAQRQAQITINLKAIEAFEANASPLANK